MSILPTRAAPSKLPAHDPDVCYIDGVTPCDGCRARAESERANLGCDTEACERRRPRAVAGRFAEQTGIPVADLDATLLPILADGVAEIVVAVLDERGAA